ncbi:MULTISPECIES: hypothetical protein [Brevibacillus]|uniref:hypothetical protein n=1 Tax=Brevibacillus TaxID=55080 RepID=UPI0004F259D3|nr:hypothetical protein [Brevibacillus borstelensis]KKX53262.1 hypothetical protein X546_20510 [Brevibacillus borstelensis cifa_chp40]
MLVINIAKNYRITSDGNLNFQIEERKLIKSTKKDVPDRYEWQVVGYYGQLLTACLALPDVVALRSEAQSAEELINELRTLKKDITVAVQGLKGSGVA